MRDLHEAPRVTVVTSATAETPDASITFSVLALQSSKTDQWRSLHAVANRIQMSRITPITLLERIGFSEYPRCSVTGSGCHAIEISTELSLDKFASEFSAAASTFCDNGKFWDGFAMGGVDNWGDGHTATAVRELARRADDRFSYVHTYVSGSEFNGWTTHVAPVEDLTPEVAAALSAVGLSTRTNCPQFDFDPCFCRVIRRRERPGTFTNDNADAAAGAFENVSKFLPRVVDALVDVDRRMRPFGMPFLKLMKPSSPVPIRSGEVTAARARASLPAVTASSFGFLYDVAISFAREQRSVAEALAADLKDAGLRVFIDSDFRHDLLGKDLAVELHKVYSKESRHSAILVSKEYVNRMWPAHERQAAVERRMRELGSDYILPIKVDGTDLPGIPTTVGHLSLDEMDIHEAAAIIVRKLRT
jgi:hypothetical protein